MRALYLLSTFRGCVDHETADKDKRLMLKWRPDRTTLFLATVAAVLAAISGIYHGAEAVWRGLLLGGRTLLQVTPLLLAAFLIAGLTQALASKEVIEGWLSARAGIKGVLLACLGGALIPGGPYVYYPIAGALLNSGAGLGVLVAFVSAKNLWSVSRLPYEIALLGPRITVMRFALTFLVPPTLGLLADALFGDFIDRIREAVQ
jgi:uncharacterized membrane protein YraQ (UPF0718 family)